MLKEGELWDDSALINSFDDAMSKYKKMHGKKKVQDDSNDAGKVGSVTGDENVSAITTVDESLNGTVNEADENSNNASTIVAEPGATKNLEPPKGNNAVDLPGPVPYLYSSNGVPTHVNDSSCSQGSEDYNQLLSQYYELEERRQRVLQQLNQYGVYNYQLPAGGSGSGSGSGGYWGACSTSQDQPVAAAQPSLFPLICSCCPYACHCPVAPCSSFATCSLGEKCLGKTCTDSSSMVVPRKSSPPVDNDIVKTAMNAAERAISSMKTKALGYSDIEGDKPEKSKDPEGETDLSVVLIAWYSAGFYTGKYLTEPHG